MTFCTNCGSRLGYGYTKCPVCGAEAEGIKEEPNSDTHTCCCTGQTGMNGGIQLNHDDIQQNKAMAIISYLGILFLIPLLACKNSPFARYHANQGLILFITWGVYFVSDIILSMMLLSISWRLSSVTSIFLLGYIALFALMVIGIINAANGQAKELPVIGRFTLIK